MRRARTLSGILRQRRRRRVDALLSCEPRALRRDLLVAYRSNGRPDLNRVRRVFSKHGVTSKALQALVLSTLPRVTRMRLYSAVAGVA